MMMRRRVSLDGFANSKYMVNGMFSNLNIGFKLKTIIPSSSFPAVSASFEYISIDINCS